MMLKSELIQSYTKWHGRSKYSYSTAGLVPSATVSKPWGIAITGTICSEDAKHVGEAWLDSN
jgi:hypothetical protein